MRNPSDTDQQIPRPMMSQRTLMTSAATVAASSIALFPNQTIAQSSSTKETIMSAEKFADVVRRGYHGFNTADMALLTQVFDTNSTWEPPPQVTNRQLAKGP